MKFGYNATQSGGTVRVAVRVDVVCGVCVRAGRLWMRGKRKERENEFGRFIIVRGPLVVGSATLLFLQTSLKKQ